MKLFFAVLLSFYAICLPTLSQPRLTLEKNTYSLGQIEWKRSVSMEYTVTNTGDKPLVLTNITASCGCLAIDWTKLPIQPNHKGVINLTFDAQLLGHFNKSICIYSNTSPELTYLNITGEVVKEIKDYTHIYPYVVGQIRMDKKEISFSEVHHGEHPTITLNIINLSDRSYKPELMHLPPFLTPEMKPDMLQKGERGMIKLTLETDKLTKGEAIQTSVYLSRFFNDEATKENEIPISFTLSDVPLKISGRNIPSIHLSQMDVTFNSKTSTNKSYDVVITNTGQSLLRIEKLQVNNPNIIKAEMKKTEIRPGKKTKMNISLQRNNITQSDKEQIQILMITNDPIRPIVIINVKLLSESVEK
ncbi:MAG: DUF1573 domain-containing protein [Mediterranea sp.]|jgi:hypothetical protein|nr:DUF1573 domain-containing protein [Mediterranea sp.]